MGENSNRLGVMYVCPFKSKPTSPARRMLGGSYIKYIINSNLGQDQETNHQITICNPQEESTSCISCIFSLNVQMEGNSNVIINFFFSNKHHHTILGKSYSCSFH